MEQFETDTSRCAIELINNYKYGLLQKLVIFK